MSVSRFYVRGELPKDVRRSFSQRVALRVFVPLQPEEEAEERLGWCALGAPADLQLNATKIFNEHYLCLGLRHDRYRFPPTLVQAELQRLIKSEGAVPDKLSKAAQKQFKERVIKALRKRLLPSLRAYDMVWNLDLGVVSLFSHSAQAAQRFTELFEITFGVELDADSPFVTARQLLTAAKHHKALGEVEPSHYHALAVAPEGGAAGSVEVDVAGPVEIDVADPVDVDEPAPASRMGVKHRSHTTEPRHSPVESSHT